MENFGKFIAIVLSSVAGCIVNGFVILKLWSWFIVPTLSLNPLRLAEAIGIMFLVNYLMAKRYSGDAKEGFWDRVSKDLFFVVTYSILTLLFGWIVSLFI